MDGCDVEMCPECGHQLISCDCQEIDGDERMPWSGEWPGLAACREFGWYSKLVPGKGWVGCEKSDPEATEDLNRLHMEAVWDKNVKRWVRESDYASPDPS